MSASEKLAGSKTSAPATGWPFLLSVPALIEALEGQSPCANHAHQELGIETTRINLDMRVSYCANEGSRQALHYTLRRHTHALCLPYMPHRYATNVNKESPTPIAHAALCKIYLRACSSACSSVPSSSSSSGSGGGGLSLPASSGPM